MRTTWQILPAALMLTLLARPAAAQNDVKAVIEKAIKAHGGEEKLSKYKASTMKGKGKISLMGNDAEFKMEAST